jgi:hypothetical protein
LGNRSDPATHKLSPSVWFTGGLHGAHGGSQGFYLHDGSRDASPCSRGIERACPSRLSVPGHPRLSNVRGAAPATASRSLSLQLWCESISGLLTSSSPDHGLFLEFVTSIHQRYWLFLRHSLHYASMAGILPAAPFHLLATLYPASPFADIKDELGYLSVSCG